MTILSLRTIFLTLILSLLFFLGNFSISFAQQAGLSITPALIEETLDPDTTKEYSITIKNLDSSRQTYYLKTRNISSVGDGGVPIFAEEFEKTGMELADWIELSQSEFSLEPGESTRISFTMRVPENATPGSHFGGIFTSVDAPEIENSGAAVGYQVANIISIRVSGEVNEIASIRQFATDKFLYGSQNVTFDVRIENGGNVLVRPTGPLEIFNMLGQKVDIITFNEQQSAVFPQDVRQYTLDWQGTGVGFGRYEAILSSVYGDDGAKKTMSSTVSFWVLPMNIIGPALIALAVLLLITFVIVKLYINRTLARYSQGRTRIVRNRRRQSSSPLLLLTVVMLVVIVIFLIILLALFA